MGLRIANALVYATLAAFGVASIGAPLADALRALSRPYAYAPDLTLPWLWISLGLVVALLVGEVARRLAAGAKVGMLRYVLLLLAVAGCLGARRTVEAPRRATVEDGLGHAIARVELAADDAWAKEKRYPGKPFKVELPPVVRELGFYERGAAALPVRVVVVGDALEPVLAAHGRRPGEVVFATDPDGTRYWITAFTLDRRGRVAPLTDEAGRVVVASGASGHPRSRLDPAFPDYPRKLPLRGGAGAGP